MTVYDPKTPQVWRVPYRDAVVPTLSVRAPLGGYVVPCEWAQEIGARLGLHGITCEPVRAPSREVRVEAFRATRDAVRGRTVRGPHAFEPQRRLAA